MFVMLISSVGILVSAAQVDVTEIQPRGNYLKCGGFTDYVCRGDVVRSETGTHKCGVL